MGQICLTLCAVPSRNLRPIRNSFSQLRRFTGQFSDANLPKKCFVRSHIRPRPDSHPLQEGQSVLSGVTNEGHRDECTRQDTHTIDGWIVRPDCPSDGDLPREYAFSLISAIFSLCTILLVPFVHRASFGQLAKRAIAGGLFTGPLNRFPLSVRRSFAPITGNLLTCC